MQLRSGHPGRNGFTLIEICICLTIIGILIGVFGPMYRIYQETQQERVTSRNLQIVTNAIGDYRSLHGHYPCPARYDVARGQAGYGMEQNCSIQTQLDNSCVNGTCIETWPSPTPLTIPNIRIRIGSLPFRTMNIDEEVTYDGYGHRYTYVVSEDLATRAGYRDRRGGIRVFDDNGNLVSTNPPLGPHFAVVSHGSNGSGSVVSTGVRAPCPAGTLESENCDFPGAAPGVFILASRNTSVGAGYFDDSLTYFLQQEAPLWELQDITSTHIAAKSGARVGVGASGNFSLAEKLQVDGSMGVLDDPETATPEGKILAESICNSLSSDTPTLPGPVPNPNYKLDCFPSNRIAGSIGSGGGLECPTGWYMVGIDHNVPRCEQYVTMRCPAGQGLVGFNADGTLDCLTVPAADCTSGDIEVCGGTTDAQTYTPPATPHGSVWTSPVTGESRIEKWRCSGGSWVFQPLGSTGVCECVSGPYGDILNPANFSRACGPGYAGDEECTRSRLCPSGTIVVDCDRGNCVCGPRTETQPLACPSGYTGTKHQTRDWSCPGGPGGDGVWSAWAVTDNCSCTPATETRTTACAGGLTGAITQERHFTCSPNEWSDWADTANTCACVPFGETRLKTCPPGKEGAPSETRNFTCPAATYTGWVDSTPAGDECQVTFRVVYTWEPQTSGEISRLVRTGPRAGRSCTPPGSTGPCHKRTRRGYVNYSVCACGG